MIKTYTRLPMKYWTMRFLSVILLWFVGSSIMNVSAQILSCHEHVNISLDSNCQAIITPADVVTDVLAAGPDLIVEIHNRFGVLLPDTLGIEHRGIDFLVVVIDSTTQNSCWGTILIEDKHPPYIECIDTTISCFQLLPTFPNVSDNCSDKAVVELLKQQYFDYLCDNDSIIGQITRTVISVDGWGNSLRCEQTISLARDSLAGLICPSDSIIVECCEQRFDPEQGEIVDALWSPYFTNIDSMGYPHPIPRVDEEGNSVGLVAPPYKINGTDTTYFLKLENRRCNVHVSYHDHVFPLCGYSYKIKRQWYLKDLCTAETDTCIQYFSILDTLPPVATVDTLIEAYTSHTECKAHVELIAPTILEECGFKYEKEDSTEALKDITIIYDIERIGLPQHGKQTFYTGRIPAQGKERLYLPKGQYRVTYIVRDGCFNESYLYQTIKVYDQYAPNPVCKGGLSVTLSPDSCHARVWAYEFDNGSFDNCCEELHFAAAHKDTIEYWKEYWYEELTACYDEHHITAEQDSMIHQTIDHWIECYIYDDYVDVFDCGKDRISVKVYEACGMPTKDPHIFRGSDHQWYCFNVYDDFACHYKANYDTIAIKYLNFPRPILTCDFDDLVFSEDFQCTAFSFGPSHDGILQDVEPNPVCCDFEGDNDHPLYLKWLAVKEKYPAFVELANRRYTFPHKHSTCWIDLEKVDKIAPTCSIDPDVTVYCDGLADVGFLVIDGVKRSFAGIKYASNNPCYNPVKLPWSEFPHGYYNGPMSTGYEYMPYDEETCVKQFLFHEYPKPIYCRFWLLLDRFDNHDQERDFESFFTPLTAFDNCSVAKIDTIFDENINECGNGYLSRVYTIYDQCGNSTWCEQKVLVKPRSDFEVIFPKDTTVVCEIGSDLFSVDDALGYPIISDDDCELIGINIKDQLVESYNHEVCMKIVREWTVIDWCVFQQERPIEDPDIIVDDRIVASDDRSCVVRNLKDNGDGVIKYQQIIYVIDENPPMLTCLDDYAVSHTQDDCQNILIDTILGEAVDGCTPADAILYSWYIDLFRNSAPSDYLRGEGNRLNRGLPSGKHTIYLTATDQCGNADTCQYDLDIRDEKQPTPYCFEGIATVIMQNPNQELSIWARDLDAGSYDNCDPDGENLQFAFDKFFMETYTVFDCDDLGFNEIQIFVRDASGNVDFCTTYIEVQAGSIACGDTTSSVVIDPMNELNGDVETEDKNRGAGDETAEMIQIRQNARADLSEESQHLLVSQNAPNPFSKRSEIAITSMITQEVTISIYAVDGTMEHQANRVLQKGQNRFVFESEWFRSAGIHYYQVQAGKEVFTRKMLYLP